MYELEKNVVCIVLEYYMGELIILIFLKSVVFFVMRCSLNRDVEKFIGLVFLGEFLRDIVEEFRNMLEIVNFYCYLDLRGVIL